MYRNSMSSHSILLAYNLTVIVFSSRPIIQVCLDQSRLITINCLSRSARTTSKSSHLKTLSYTPIHLICTIKPRSHTHVAFFCHMTSAVLTFFKTNTQSQYYRYILQVLQHKQLGWHIFKNTLHAPQYTSALGIIAFS